jgi:hypothetical protein
VGFVLLRDKKQKGVRSNETHSNSRPTTYSSNDHWGGNGLWRAAHHILGALLLVLGLINICLGVFLAVLPLAVWIIWYIYFGFLVLLLIGMEIIGLLDRGKTAASNGKAPSGKANSSLVLERTQSSNRDAFYLFD